MPFKPSITNAIPVVFRHILLLESAVKNILNQTVLPNEIILCISNYRPKTASERKSADEIIIKIKQAVPRSIKLKVVINKKGMYAGKNRQTAYHLCTSDIIIYQDCDDFCHKQRNEIFLKSYLKTKAPSICHGWTRDLDALKTLINFNEIELVDRASCKKTCVHNGAIFLNKSMIGHIKKFPNSKKGQDVLFNKMLSKRNIPSKVILCNDLYVYNHYLSSKRGGKGPVPPDKLKPQW